MKHIIHVLNTLNCDTVVVNKLVDNSKTVHYHKRGEETLMIKKMPGGKRVKALDLVHTYYYDRNNECTLSVEPCGETVKCTFYPTNYRNGKKRGYTTVLGNVRSIVEAEDMAFGDQKMLSAEPVTIPEKISDRCRYYMPDDLLEGQKPAFVQIHTDQNDIFFYHKWKKGGLHFLTNSVGDIFLGVNVTERGIPSIIYYGGLEYNDYGWLERARSFYNVKMQRTYTEAIEVGLDTLDITVPIRGSELYV
ncbi:MAG: hypothetical protein ACLQQ4_07425 [Bacteroidia bacterium]